MMVTPKVREEARNHFNCPDLEGAEIESQGGLGTAGSHWEKRVFENEAMTGVTTQVYALSRLTLALFEDSGWYKVNYEWVLPNYESALKTASISWNSSKAEEMKWGQGLGCKFAKQSCLTWMKANIKDPYPYCNVLGDTRCADSRRAKVRCNLVSGSKRLPSTYDYNVKNLFWDKKGRSIRGYGHVSVADYCPYYRVETFEIYGDVSKEDTDTRCTFAENMNYNNYSLEVLPFKVKIISADAEGLHVICKNLQIFSPSARCFELDGDGGIAIRNEHGTNTWLHSVGCFEVNIYSLGRSENVTSGGETIICYHLVPVFIRTQPYHTQFSIQTVCEKNLLYIKTQKSKFYPCHRKGQLIYVKKRVHGVGTIKTRIVCPSCAELCGKLFCAPERHIHERIGDSARRSPFNFLYPLFIFVLAVVFHIL
ncbi:hypothetical protein ANCDUO_10714 [Ancylostoma duodenale]|uniref:Leishmanolysin-like peptidase n=1 Tax=Ancylostoma duodenale TaxID=51022 RepID=A0A0C2CQM1_9BILA|nr:hypothetical protein ANCDUO_10714 [Ancylostoma duodenale]